MNRTLIAFLILVVAGVAAAKSTPQPANPDSQNTAPAAASANQTQAQNKIPAGVVIPVELSKSLDAKKLKSGDKVEARTAMDLLSQGKIVLPRDSKIIGHVTEAKAHSKDSPDSSLGIAFDRVVMKDGRELQMQAAIQAIARPLHSAALDESAPMNDSGGMPSAGTPTMSGGGGMGGTMPRSPSSVGGYPSGTSSSPTDTGSATSGAAPLGPTSQGVVGMKGLELRSGQQGSVISSEKDNVKLDSGTQLMLRTL